ncbi:MAG TPA: hypothetical protein ENG66_06085 [Thermococcus sp.]|nr:hypothetical protein [Thermococcus sp.]
MQRRDPQNEKTICVVVKAQNWNKLKAYASLKGLKMREVLDIVIEEFFKNRDVRVSEMPKLKIKSN